MNKKPTRVLIVEGDADDASLIGGYLSCAPGSEENLVFTRAPRLSTACHLLTRQSFDAVLLDLVLPQTSGLEGFLKIRALRPSAPVIILTGKKDEALAARAVKLGAQDYFIKGSPDCQLLKRAIRYAIERKLLSSEIEDLLAVDAAPQLVLDADGVVRFANSAVEPLLGRPPVALVDKPFGHAVREGEEELVLTTARAREKRVKMRVRPISWYGEPARLISLLDGEPDGGLSIMEARNHFLSRISHELRNTLATMKTAAYCLKEGSDDKLTEQQTQLVDMISRNVNRQARIAENILDLTRFRSGKLNIQLQPANAASIIAALVEEQRLSRGAHRRIQVRVNGVLPDIMCDPDLIAQVLRNLLDNALRFAKEKIVIEASKAGPAGISISVTDDGAGIPKEHFDGLFTHFLRLEGPDHASAHRGTGLGLAICKEIVEGHHGSIRAENAAGHGARFSFDLPVRGGAQKAPARDGRISATGLLRAAYSGKRSYLLHK